MLISCNKLKSYIKNSDQIDWQNIWDKFTIRTAEVEDVTIKGNDLKDVVVAEIVSCEPHPTKEKYHILKVSDGEKEYDILCGAPNVKVGLKAPLVKVGGMVSGFTISEKKIAGVLSQGMLCAMDELGIGSDHTGILELPNDAVLGVDICDVLPFKDIIVKIDNKSLTNRPDLWGHYGIAREIAAIAKKELLPLELEEIVNDKKDLDITIEDPDLCYRYCGLKVENVLNNKTPIDMQIFLHYTGFRSISLMVDLTNYLLLELGQPMHAFDSKIVKKITVGLAKDADSFTTLDGVERVLNKNNLMIKNGKEYFAIAGVMGGLDSEITESTDSLFLESATFNATSIRKTAISHGLRTEASARYEKSLDPNMTDIAIRRYVKLLKEENPHLVIASNLTDKYPTKVDEKEIELSKGLLNKYLGFDIKEKEVEDILKSLGFKVKTLKDKYTVVVPTFRATKDISLSVDLIEEIARMYGYENFEPTPLCLPLTFTEHETGYTDMYNVKNFLADRYKLHEVNSYLWYDSSLLKLLNIEKENVQLLGKTDNNVLRDNLTLSLLSIVKENFKHQDNVNIFEIGTTIINNENHLHLCVILAGDDNLAQKNYYIAKNLVTNLVKSFKNKQVTFVADMNENVQTEVNQDFFVDNLQLGNITLLSSSLSNKLGKKKSIVSVELDFDKFLSISKELVTYKPLSKYPETTLDYTIIASLDINYDKIEAIINNFKNEFIINYKLIDVYENDNEVKYTIRYNVGSQERTLNQKDLEKFKNTFIEHIKKNDLDIIQ